MKQLLILSGKGGTGKTSLAGSLIRLAEAKACADCDVDAPNLHLMIQPFSPPKRRDYYGMPKAFIDESLCIHCGQCKEHCRFYAIQENGVYQIDPLLCEGCGVCEAICPEKAVSLREYVTGELLLYKDPGRVFSTACLKIGSGTTGLLVTEVKKQMNENSMPNTPLAVIDGSPGIGCPVIASLNGVSMVLIVTEPSVSGINDMERILHTAEIFHTKIAVCINKYDTNLSHTAEIVDFCKRKGYPLVGKIPYDPEAVRAVNSGKTMVDSDCPSGRAVRSIFDQIIQFI
jgi:MinD superfamily P-loop ATPase